jgi:hypothetical protein
MRLSAIGAPLVALAVVFLHAQPVMAAGLFFSASGSGTTCSLSTPCAIQTAITEGGNGQIACADGRDVFANPIIISASIIIDCAGTAGSVEIVAVNGGTVVLRNLSMWGFGNLLTLNSGTLVLENVHITDSPTTAITAQPTSASTLVLRNCLIDATVAGILLKPQAGGSLSVRLDHVTITGNTGGGLKVDTTNGPVTIDVTDSEISSNGGNGINVVGNPGGQAMMSIKNSVIAKNGAAGVQANGANAGVLVQTTLLDQNAAGATDAVNGGHISTYGTNSIVGSVGSGFTGSASLQ